MTNLLQSCSRWQTRLLELPKHSNNWRHSSHNYNKQWPSSKHKLPADPRTHTPLLFNPGVGEAVAVAIASTTMDVATISASATLRSIAGLSVAVGISVPLALQNFRAITILLLSKTKWEAIPTIVLPDGVGPKNQM
jgi:hypothetical protein